MPQTPRSGRFSNNSGVLTVFLVDISEYRGIAEFGHTALLSRNLSIINYRGTIEATILIAVWFSGHLRHEGFHEVP